MENAIRKEFEHDFYALLDLCYRHMGTEEIKMANAHLHNIYRSFSEMEQTAQDCSILAAVRKDNMATDQEIEAEWRRVFLSKIESRLPLLKEKEAA